MKSGLAGNIAQTFINSKLTPLLMGAFLVIGFYGAWLTPREEEPQINVPTADIFVRFPGATVQEIEQRVTTPLERAVSNINGIEYVYSTSMPEMAMITARYFVGEDVEDSMVKLYTELLKNMDRMPQSVSMPLIKTRSIDDVPMFAFTLHSEVYSDVELRELASEIAFEMKQINNIAQISIIGGRSRAITIQPDPQKLALYNVDINQIAQIIHGSSARGVQGTVTQNDQNYIVETGDLFTTSEEIERLMVGVRDGEPIYLTDIATIKDAPEEATQFVEFGFGAGSEQFSGVTTNPAVTIAFSKRTGTDAMRLSEEVVEKLDAIQARLVPAEVSVEVTRNYGETASEKVSELLKHLFGAIVAVTIVVALSMGWRGGFVVFASVPVTFALTLFVYYMFGYTLNRITLFALVFVTGIVVDDSIIIAENMHRHFKMKKLPFMQAAIASINEVGNPTILATITVIASVLPMAFVSGLMGPYMSPMPIGASLAMIFSLIVALIITPWLAYRFLKTEKHSDKEFHIEDTFIYRWYLNTMRPLIENTLYRWGFLTITFVLLLASMSLLYFRLVEVKMLPFDNKNEMQVVIDMPEGTPLERTHAVAKDIAFALRTEAQIKTFQIYSGTSAPINFNGLVRHYDLRRGSNVADIQLNLTHKGDRSEQSHDIAKRLRPIVHEVAAKYGANAKVVEVPPGPPVMSTLVAEVYGPDLTVQQEVADQIKTIFEETKGVVDVDWEVMASQPKYHIEVDQQKAMMAGISEHHIVQTVQAAIGGIPVARLGHETSRELIPIKVQFQQKYRSTEMDLASIPVFNAQGQSFPVGELARISKTTTEPAIFHKNMQRVTYVTAEVAGEIESPVYAILDISEKLNAIQLPEGYGLSELYTAQPFTQDNYAMKWDGEWHITYEVFRDLGAAFAVVLVIIYLLIVGWFQDFKVPFVMMVAIPLSLVGILVGHWMLGAFFTATSMIGMIALAGIMVRNSVLLIDFVNIRLDDGLGLKEAVIESGAVRTTPILLTAGTVVIGAVVILFDPIFQGLAIALMGGSIASTLLTLVIVPLIYYMTERKKHEQA